MSETPKIKFATSRKSSNRIGRIFGRHDAGEYRDLSSNISIGRSKIEGVSIECEFIFSKTRLGMLGDRPGGILYMDLTIEQPKDWGLQEANVSVILEDETRPEQSRQARRRTANKESLVMMEQYFGPEHITSRETTAEMKRGYNFTPQAQVGGIGASVGGFEKSVTQPLTSCWTFYGTHKKANASQQFTELK